MKTNVVIVIEDGKTVVKVGEQEPREAAVAAPPPAAITPAAAEEAPRPPEPATEAPLVPEPAEPAEPELEEEPEEEPRMALRAADQPDLEDYVNGAIEKAGLRSDRHLAQFMKLSPSTVNNWRKRKAWPSEDVMLELAHWAGRAPDEALLHLGLWRASSERVRSVLTHVLGLIHAERARQSRRPPSA